MIRQTALLILMFLATVITCQANDITVKSPNGALSVTINNNGGKASYSVALNGKTVLNQSALGLMTSLGDLTQGLTLADSRTSKVELHYDMKKTKASHSDYFANELTAVFKNNQKQVLEVTFRVSDNDVAFRYNISIEHPDREPDLQRLLILSEASSFNFPDNTTTYLCPMAAPGILWAHARPSYEEVYTPDA
ncbi:MAG: glycoside hydrolase family 97 N-terminal domain-containing protein, partial [Bacteroidales bacterium]|nr:glycoside hydrolase family 97 N-terminal domain-containing protein [Bacteroidales bacterium]